MVQIANFVVCDIKALKNTNIVPETAYPYVMLYPNHYWKFQQKPVEIIKIIFHDI